MIKVLNNNTNEQKLYRQICDVCGAELEFSFDDTYIGAYGARYLKCPNCGREVLAEKLDGINLNSNNIRFPEHFCEPGGLDVSDDQIEVWVRDCLRMAEESDDPYGYFVQIGTGNTMVILLAYEDEYEIIVTKDYYHTSVNRELR